MQTEKAFYAVILGLALSGQASGQVYETKDADGNPVFSDKPSENARVVEVPPTNSADPVADIPRPSPAATAPATRSQAGDNAARRTQPEGGNDDDYIYYGGGAVNSDEAQQRREELKARREEGAGKPGREPPAQVQPHRNVSRPAGGGGGRR